MNVWLQQENIADLRDYANSPLLGLAQDLPSSNFRLTSLTNSAILYPTLAN